MKAWFHFGVPLLLSLLVATSRQPGDSIEASTLIALENAWNLAQLHHDGKALESVVSDNFVYTDYDGTVMDRAKFMADIKDQSYRLSLIANDHVKVNLYQNAAVVVGTYHTKGTFKGKPFEHYGRFTDMWIYQNNRWQCVASHTNLIRK